MSNHSITVTAGMLLDGRYRLLRPLSSDGGTADVWLALDTNTIDEVYDDEADTMAAVEDSGIKVAIKIYRPKNALDIGEQRFREEFKIVFNCHHSNLVQPINFSICDGTPYLVLPYCRNGSSEQFQGSFHDKDRLWKYIADVSAGLAYLHAFNPTIVHHDIKPANVLVDDSGNFAITDFGISSHRGLNREGYDDSQSGTMAYMAPERFDEGYESMPESDVWSFGATLYELVTGKVPFGEGGGAAQVDSGQAPPSIEAPIPADIRNLIADCLAADPASRPSAAAISKAAAARRYPLRNRTWLYVAIGAVAAAAIAVLAVLLLDGRRDEQPEPPRPVPDNVRFERAVGLMSTGSSDDLVSGLAILDTLVARSYIPAIYEQAYTYGWYADSASVARKELLGIDMYPASTNEQWLPRPDHINRKAIGLLTKIEELNDSAYPDINARALYKLACYYFNTNKVFARDPDRAEQLSEQALKWARMCDNRELADKINRNLEIIRDNK